MPVVAVAVAVAVTVTLSEAIILFHLMYINGESKKIFHFYFIMANQEVDYLPHFNWTRFYIIDKINGPEYVIKIFPDKITNDVGEPVIPAFQTDKWKERFQVVRRFFNADTPKDRYIMIKGVLYDTSKSTLFGEEGDMCIKIYDITTNLTTVSNLLEDYDTNEICFPWGYILDVCDATNIKPMPIIFNTEPLEPNQFRRYEGTRKRADFK